jgi:hypothetical protein
MFIGRGGGISAEMFMVIGVDIVASATMYAFDQIACCHR